MHREARDGSDKNLKRLESDIAAKDKEIETIRGNLTKAEAEIAKLTSERDAERKRECECVYT